jgi:hypothetical protein
MPAPAMYWWHMRQALSVADGVNRALAVMGTTADGDIEREEDKIRLVTSNFRALIKCLPWREGEVLTIIIVAGNNGDETRGIMEELRNGMRGGVLE